MKIDMLSDWGVGAGVGTVALADWEVSRDSSGLPYLPAKTLTGVLRHSAEQAAQALDGGSDGEWSSWVEWLFGSEPARQRGSGQRGKQSVDGSLLAPSPAVLSIRAAHVDTGSVSAAAMRRPVAERPMLKVDEETGTAVPGQFRLIQAARFDLPLVATITARGFDEIADLPDPAKVLLGLAVRLTDSVGGKRRRGFGRCRIAVEGIDPARLAQTLQGMGSPGLPPAGDVPQADDAINEALPEGQYRLVAYVDIQTVSPVTVRPKITGNSISTSRVIPGTVLLPRIARAIGAQTGDLIRRGDLVVTDAFPVDPTTGEIALPIPATLQRVKRPRPGDPRRLYSRTHGAPLLADGAAPKMTGATGFISDALGPAGARVLADVPVQQTAHAIIDDASQRPTSETGGLFVQEGIVPGIRFRAQVWSTVDVPESSSSESYAIGRSKKDDYGDVRLTITPVKDDTPRVPNAAAANGQLTVRLLSDLLLRDPRTGAYTTTPSGVVAALRDVLGDSGLDLDLDSSALSAVTSDSWQVRWGLPRPTLLALAAGSVLVLTNASSVSRDALVLLEQRGLGDRRAEGFGRVRFNDSLLREGQVDVQEGSFESTEGNE